MIGRLVSKMETIRLATDYSRFPGGRFVSDGPFNGEAFREEHLLPRLRSDADLVVVVLDGVAGLPASFLEEAFGGLVRAGFTPDELHRRLKVVATTPRLQRYPAMIWGFIGWAEQAMSHAL